MLIQPLASIQVEPIPIQGRCLKHKSHWRKSTTCSHTLGVDICLLGKNNCSRWWFQTFFIVTPIWGRFASWLAYFSDGWFNHQPVLFVGLICWSFLSWNLSKFLSWNEHHEKKHHLQEKSPVVFFGNHQKFCKINTWRWWSSVLLGVPTRWGGPYKRYKWILFKTPRNSLKWMGFTWGYFTPTKWR